MRLLTFNIAYGTGSARNMKNNLLSAHHYLRAPKRNIEKICRFIRAHQPDIVALVEVDTGSFRTGFTDQARLIADNLDDAFYCSEIKYHADSIGRKLPILRKQANAILCRNSMPIIKYHYLPVGFKRLVIELDLPDFKLYLVHLALQAKTRQKQYDALAEMAKNAEKPCIITGDFNTFNGSAEQAYELYRTYYKDAAFTHVINYEVNLKDVVNTNKCVLQTQVHEGRLLVTSVIDNLLKGASGQALQNMNLMFGLDEKMGLNLKALAF